MREFAPIFDGTFDALDPGAAENFRRMVEALKVKVEASGLKSGMLLHKWLDDRHIHVLVIDSTPQGHKAVKALIGEGYLVGPAAPRPRSALSDLVERVKQSTEGNQVQNSAQDFA